jgi:DNA-binding NarL/FixJ family response regulator
MEDLDTEQQAGTIRILLVDAQRAVRRGLRMRLSLEPDLMIVAETGSGSAAMALAQTLEPDVVVLDPEMPGSEPIAMVEDLGRLCPRAAVVMLGLYCDSSTRARAREAGVYAFVEKRDGVDNLMSEIRRAARHPDRNEVTA